MNTKPGQRVALYTVTERTPDAPESITVGMTLVDRPRGEHTSWDFLDGKGQVSTVSATRLGFARVNADGKSHTPEPALQAKLDAMNAAA